MRPASVASGRPGRLPGIEDGVFIGRSRDGHRRALAGDSGAATALGAAVGLGLGVLAVSAFVGLHGLGLAVLVVALAAALIGPGLSAGSRADRPAAHMRWLTATDEPGEGAAEPGDPAAETRVAHRLYGREPGEEPGEEPGVRRRPRAA